MLLTVTTQNDDIFTLDVNGDMELENFKVLLEFESGMDKSNMNLIWNGQLLKDNGKKMSEYGICNGDMLLLQRGGSVASSSTNSSVNPRQTGSNPPSIDFSSIQIPSSSNEPVPQNVHAMPENAAMLRDRLLSSPHDLAVLKERNPALAEALISGDLDKFTAMVQEIQQVRAEKERERIQMLTADPFDPAIQDKIAEEIRLKNVETNMETAMEFSPESFGQVAMLYINCTVNGKPVKAFVDSGAQMTIMSKKCAERCNIGRLVDTRWAGVAKGVGVQKIIGRVHLCPISIGRDHLQSSFSILEEQPMDMLLGLDMLRRHQCCIDLKRNVLIIGTTGTETLFLNENELPEHAQLNKEYSETTIDEDRALAEALAKSSGESTAIPASTVSFSEDSITKLTDYGFSRPQVIEELQKADGNIDQALAALFSQSFQGHS